MEKVVNRLIVVTFAAALIFGALAYRFRDAEHDSAYREDLSFSLCEYIDIDLNRMDVTVTPYDGDLIMVSYAGNLPLDFVIGDNHLSISESEKYMISLFMDGNNDHKLELTLPRRVFREISVYTGTGRVNVGDIDSGVISVITNSGDIRCEGVASRCSISTTSGNVTVDFEEVVSGTSILTRSGNADLLLPKNSSVEINFETETGECVTDLWNGSVAGSYRYGFNGGDRLINAAIGSGTLKINEKG